MVTGRYFYNFQDCLFLLHASTWQHCLRIKFKIITSLLALPNKPYLTALKVNGSPAIKRYCVKVCRWLGDECSARLIGWVRAPDTHSTGGWIWTRAVLEKVKLSLCFWLSTTPWRRIGRVEVWLHSFFHLGTRWRWVITFTPRTLCPQGKCPWYPLKRRLGGPHSRSGRGGEEKNSQPLPALEPPTIQPVARRYTAELSRLMWTWLRGK
jgi:hypothetical protein